MVTVKPPTHRQILAARLKAGLTQQQAADLVFVTRSAWVRWEDAASSPSARRMPRAAWELFKIKTAKPAKT